MNERLAMWQKLDTTCGASGWDMFNSIRELAWYLLCPRSVDVARVLGCFLSTYIGACNVYDVVNTQALDNKANMRWLGGSTVLTKAIKDRLAQTLAARTNGVFVLPTCTHTSTWLSRRVHESLSSAFKPLRVVTGWVG